ncbi:MAG: FtsW/RodA/SpoVE family cell cycle protein [Lentisphaeraceae bacterium]|nr:FtsW/RodA/SpoVE family cell cycle protein [Lentisphaeraceae bacterium]
MQKIFRSFCPVLLSAILLSSWGCLAIYNASLHFPQPEYYLIRQVTWLLAGVAIALLVYRLPVKWIFEYIPWLYAMGLASLVLVLYAGKAHNNMLGWFYTPWFTVQPSEFCKPVFCLFMCWWIQRLKENSEDDALRYFKYLAAALPSFVLVALQPDFGTLLIYISIFVVVYIISSSSIKYLLWNLTAAIPFCAWVLVKYPYVLARFEGFWDPQAHASGAGYHLLQMQRAMASGGFFGRSFGKGLWSQGYLPLTHNDSIFSSFCEILGFLGGSVLVVVFSGALFGVIKKCGSMKIALYGDALFVLVFSLVMQAFVHISVNVQILPPTGITLPFFSYGGSSLISSFIIIGLCKTLIRSDKKAALLLVDERPEA